MSVNQNELTKDKLTALGLSSIFQRYNYSSDETRELFQKSLVFYPEIIEQHYDSISSREYFLDGVFSAAKKHDINLYSLPFWKSKIDEMVDCSNGIRSLYYGQTDYILSAASLVPDFSWKDLFLKLSEYQNEDSYIRAAYNKALTEFSNSDTESFKSHAESEVFFKKAGKPCYSVRAKVYDNYIRLGFLTSKTARKIRSDGSADASLSGLKSLAENKEVYSNCDELLLQFTDSKYEGVITYLAETLPPHLIPSIMGTEHYWAKRAIEQRLEKIEQEKAAENQSSFSVHHSGKSY